MKMTIRQTGENKYKRGWKLEEAEAFTLGIAIAIIFIILILL